MSANNQPYLNPASAIVLMDAKDCRSSLKRLKGRPEDERATAERLEIEEFFHSDEFQLLSNLEPELLISRLCQEVRL